MAADTSISKSAQMIITLEDNALVTDIKRALKLIRGIASVRMATVSDDKIITAVDNSYDEIKANFDDTWHNKIIASLK